MEQVLKNIAAGKPLFGKREIKQIANALVAASADSIDVDLSVFDAREDANDLALDLLDELQDKLTAAINDVPVKTKK